MPSTFTTNLGITKPATGEQAGVWGDTVNNDFDFFDTGIDGNITIPLSASAYNLVTNPGAPSDARNKVITFTGALTSDASITIGPNTAEKIYFAINHTTGGFSLNFTQGTGSTFVLRPNQSAVIYADGKGNAAGVFGALSDLQVNSLLVLTSLTVQGQLSFSGAQTVSVPMTFNGQTFLMGGVQIQPSLLLNLGGDAPYDMYFRSAPGAMTRLPIGAGGQSLVVGSAGPAWSTIQASIGMVIAGSVANRVFFANNAGQMVQDSGLQFQSGVGLGVGHAPVGGYGISVGSSLKIMLDGGANTVREATYATNSAPRWGLRLNADGEGGGNTGANFQLVVYGDGGNEIGTTISCFRSTLRTTIGGYGDYGNTLTVVSTNPGSDVLSVRAAAGQGGYLQTWIDAGGNRVASVDAAGNFISHGGGNFLALDANRRLDINGTVAGHPYGTIHLGPDAVPGQPNPSIAFEGAVGFGSAAPASIGRFYFRSAASSGDGRPKLVIQYMYLGQVLYAWLDLTTGLGQANWSITSNAT